MTRRPLRSLSLAFAFTLAVVLVLVVTLVARRQAAASQSSVATADLATLLPAGATMVLEAKDLSSLVRDWNASQTKAAWLQSANYEAFERSRLFLRLQSAYAEFSTAAGVPTDMTLLSDVAGSESALALYDIGKLEFVYVTRLPAARTMENALWRERGKYEPREAAGIAFYVRKDSDRIVAFAARDGYLLLATREDLLANALTRLAGGQTVATAAAATASVATDAWYVQAVKAAAAPGDLRLVMNLEALVKEPHFRSYWIQENVSELKAYSAGVSDLTRTATDLRETRVLVRATERPAPVPASVAAAAATTGATAGDAAFNELLRAVPASAGLYRAWVEPTAAEATQLVFEKVIATSNATAAPDRVAPTLGSTPSSAGSSSDLESRIDQETPAPRPATYDPAALDSLVASEPLTGMLQIESTHAGTDGLFVGRGSVIVLSRGSDWPRGAAREALRTLVDPVWTKAHLGMRWIDTPAGTETVSQLEGLEPLLVAERGHLLFVGNDLPLLTAVLAALARPETTTAMTTATGAIYAAGFRHALERDRFVSLMRLIDTAGDGARDSGEPPFFSSNLASLSESLSSVDTVSIVTADTGATVSQTVTYHLR